MEYNISFGKSSNPMQLKNEQHIIYPILILYETQAQMTNIEIAKAKAKQKKSRAIKSLNITPLLLLLCMMNWNMPD